MASASKEPTSKRSGAKKAPKARGAVKALAKRSARKQVGDDDDLPGDEEPEEEGPDGEKDGENGEVEEAPAAGKARRARKGKSLVIVESPAKARTINKYLGKEYVVKASMGHIRDLPKGRFGIDVENGFVPDYTTIRGKAKVISELKKLARSAPSVYLAPDMDREGEAIAWHLAESLDVSDPDKVFRVVFNEITKKAILEAFEHPGKLDMDKVEAQQARRVLDRIMGYKLSPLLWKKIAKGLSAGRVQSVAVRLIVEREKEIRAFVKEEYWKVTAYFREQGREEGREFHAELRRIGEKRVEKNLDEATARGVVARIGKDPLVLASVEEKPKTRPPTPPFTTSQLQQKASTLLRFSAKKTMMVAQQLYEGVELPGEGSVGLITYMRTDSTRVSDEAVAQARELIGAQYGAPYVPEKPNAFRTKAKSAQEAHEAIRPTEVRRLPEDLKGALTEDQHKLYALIWGKFVASQMTPSRSTVTTATFEHGDAHFVAQGEVELFDGHLRAFSGSAPSGTKRAEAIADDVAARPDEISQELPPLQVGQGYRPERLEPTQHFTQPPPRYSEATLVKELEKKGIGRPSTYATIISTIQDRGYVTLEQRRFKATELGEIVTDQLVEHFADMINTEFTSSMEQDLDRVESGQRNWREVVQGFHEVFSSDLERAEGAMKDLKKEPELSEHKCDKCGSPMAVLYNKRGKFLGCSKYPECKNTMPLDGPRPKSEVIETDHVCEKCHKPMVIRTGRRGRFLACTGFPKCKNTASVDEQGNVVRPKPTGIACDKCGAEMVVRGSKRGPFLACSAYPKCRNAKQLPESMREKPRETGEVCDKCGKPMVEKTSRWGKPFLACSGYPECKNARDVAPPAAGAAAPQAAADES
jgi:DNA topoisomerase-1